MTLFACPQCTPSPLADPAAVRWGGWLALVLLFAGGCKKEVETAPTPSVDVTAEHPSYVAITAEVEADATLAPVAQASLAARVSAPIRAEYVQRGARVRKGQLLLRLDDRDLQGAALDSKGNLTVAQAAYTAATKATNPDQIQQAQTDAATDKAALDVATRTAEDRRRLFQQGALSGREADAAVGAQVQAQAAYDAAQKRLSTTLDTTRQTTREAAQGQLTSAEGRYQSAEAQAGYGALRSPIDGVVTDRPFFPGDTAAAGTSVMTVMDTSSLLAKLHLAQAAAQQLAVGGGAEIEVPGVPDPVQATVAFISPALDPGSTTVEVWLRLANPGGRFKVGTPVHAVLHGGTDPHALRIPAAAIVPGAESGTAVMVVGPDGQAHKRAVSLGIRTLDAVQITSGLSPTDTVIVDGGYGLDDGTPVKVHAPGEVGEADKAPGQAPD